MLTGTPPGGHLFKFTANLISSETCRFDVQIRCDVTSVRDSSCCRSTRRGLLFLKALPVVLPAIKIIVSHYEYDLHNLTNRIFSSREPEATRKTDL